MAQTDSEAFSRIFLEALKNPPSNKSGKFSFYYPRINKKIKDGWSHLSIIEYLKTLDLDLTYKTFETYLFRERKKRSSPKKKTNYLELIEKNRRLEELIILEEIRVLNERLDELKIADAEHKKMQEERARATAFED